RRVPPVGDLLAELEGAPFALLLAGLGRVDLVVVGGHGGLLKVYPIVIGKAAGKLRICGCDKPTQLLLRNCDNQYMAKDEEEKKQEGEQPPPETILETEKQRDPEEATFAEQAIHAYAEEILQTFRESVENALDGFMAWVESNNDGKLFDNAGFNTQI